MNSHQLPVSSNLTIFCESVSLVDLDNQHRVLAVSLSIPDRLTVLIYWDIRSGRRMLQHFTLHPQGVFFVDRFTVLYLTLRHDW
jgi:hypothetical protein